MLLYILNMDPRTELAGDRVAELGHILEGVRQKCEGEDGVEFIKGVKPGEKPQLAANAIYDELMLKLLDIAEASHKGAVSPGLDTTDFETVLRSVGGMVGVCNALASDQILLYRDIREEARYRKMDDNVSAYMAANVRLGNFDYEKIEIAIRERLWRKPIGSDVRREDIAQPKFAIVIKPKSHPQDEIRIRVDNESLQWGGKIAYDISVGGRDAWDRMNRLSFEGLPQRAGHHFDSNISPKDFGVGFGEVLGAFNGKLASVARTPVFAGRA